MLIFFYTTSTKVPDLRFKLSKQVHTEKPPKRATHLFKELVEAKAEPEGECLLDLYIRKVHTTHLLMIVNANPHPLDV